MYLNKRGAALLQVLIVSAVLASMATMILRATLARTSSSNRTRHTVTAQMAIENCMAEVNTIWASKTPEAYDRDLRKCQFCDATADAEAGCPSQNPDHRIRINGSDIIYENQRHVCSVYIPRQTSSFTVNADMVKGADDRCELTYMIENGIDL